MTVVSLFMDLSKVFYSVSHNKLIEELNTMGVLLPKWQKLFKLYLTNWKQYVKISQMFNFIARFQLRVQTITLGIPQGSNLGPFCSYCMLCVGFKWLFKLSFVCIVGYVNIYSFAWETVYGVNSQLMSLRVCRYNWLYHFR